MGKILGYFGSLASLIALIFTTDNTIIGKIEIIIGIIFLILSIILELREYKKNKPLTFKRKENIEYLCNIIKNEGKIIVFAGELSWVDSDEVRKILKDKGKDLTLFVKDTAPELDEYKKAGVKIYTYKDSDISPKVRFTIIRPNQITEKIAITLLMDDSHTQKRVVYEISNNDTDYKSKWIMYMAKDLINLIKLSKEG